MNSPFMNQNNLSSRTAKDGTVFGNQWEAKTHDTIEGVTRSKGQFDRYSSSSSSSGQQSSGPGGALEVFGYVLSALVLLLIGFVFFKLIMP